MDRNALDQALLAAHATQDTAALVRLYTIAGDQAERDQDIDAACFYLTQAFVYALEAGAPEAQTLNKRLADRNRATRLEF